MTLHTFEFTDPSRLIEEVAAGVRLEDDAAFLVLVAHPSTEQCIVLVQRFDVPAVLDDYREASEEIRTRVQALPLPDARIPTHSVVTVVVRRGLCVIGARESHWFNAWRYANHFAPVFGSDLILVTEHGWTDFTTGFGGTVPALRQPRPGRSGGSASAGRAPGGCPADR